MKSLAAKHIAPMKNITKVVSENLYRITIDRDEENIEVKQYI